MSRTSKRLLKAEVVLRVPGCDPQSVTLTKHIRGPGWECSFTLLYQESNPPINWVLLAAGVRAGPLEWGASLYREIAGRGPSPRAAVDDALGQAAAFLLTLRRPDDPA